MSSWGVSHSNCCFSRDILINTCQQPISNTVLNLKVVQSNKFLKKMKTIFIWDTRDWKKWWWKRLSLKEAVEFHASTRKILISSKSCWFHPLNTQESRCLLWWGRLPVPNPTFVHCFKARASPPNQTWVRAQIPAVNRGGTRYAWINSFVFAKYSRLIAHALRDQCVWRCDHGEA